mmetsp:Transcript_86836/g.235321  ORF Transcript_86836/g.235321 Transcript_86836/m.235321 type:complete len:213 (-) Transcript_86836:397-1035(-)
MDANHAQRSVGAPVEAEVRPAALVHVVLNDVQHLSELGEDNYPVASSPQAHKQAVQQSELAARRHQGLAGRLLRILRAVEQVWMVAGFPQLRYEGDKLLVLAGATHIALLDLTEQKGVFHQQPPVPEQLHRRQRAIDTDLILGWQALLHVYLQATHHEDAQQAPHIVQRLLVRAPLSLLVGLHEAIQREHARVEELEQRVQLLQIVLNGCSG